MEDPARTQARNITIGVVFAVILAIIFPCLIAALVAFGVAAYYASQSPAAAPPNTLLPEEPFHAPSAAMYNATPRVIIEASWENPDSCNQRDQSEF